MRSMVMLVLLAFRPPAKYPDVEITNREIAETERAKVRPLDQYMQGWADREGDERSWGPWLLRALLTIVGGVAVGLFLWWLVGVVWPHA